MKTICFDLRALQIGHENRGIGMYIKSFLENIPRSDNRYIFYVFDRSNPIEELGIKFSNDFELIQTTTIKTSVNAPGDIIGLLRLVNHTFHPLKTKRPDVFVQFDFMLGMPRWKRTRNIAIAYDLIPLIKRNEYLPTVRFAWQHSSGKKAKLRAVVRSVYYRFKYRLHYKTYKRADGIISISQSTTKSFVSLLGIDEHKIHTIAPAPVITSEKADNSIVDRIDKPFVLYIGGTDSRKKIQDIVHAFNIAKGRGTDIALVLAGSEFRQLEHLPSVEGRNAILRSPYKDDIHLVGFVSDEQKIALYQSAYAFVFCTIYEGFGLPILEAMSAGCPVISYDNSSIPEAAGHAALLVETNDCVAVADKLVGLQDKALRQELVKAGLEQSKKFGWHGTSKEMLHVIEQA